jgi:hypothetical protein
MQMRIFASQNRVRIIHSCLHGADLIFACFGEDMQKKKKRVLDTASYPTPTKIIFRQAERIPYGG